MYCPFSCVVFNNRVDCLLTGRIEYFRNIYKGYLFALKEINTEIVSREFMEKDLYVIRSCVSEINIYYKKIKYFPQIKKAKKNKGFLLDVKR